MRNILKKTALIGVFYYLLVLVNACCDCRDYQKPMYFSIEDINVRIVQYNFEGDTLIRIFPVAADSVALKKYGVQINLETKQLANESYSDFLQLSNSYACKCAVDNIFLNDTIKDAHIKTLVDFDATHPAGSNVDDCFSYPETVYSSGKTKVTLSSINKRPVYTTPYQSFDFYLSKNPTAGNKVQFEVSLKTTKGKTYTRTTTTTKLF